MPRGFTLGYSLQKEDKWRLAVEYKTEQWSQFEWANTNDSFGDASEISAGFIINPEKSRESFKDIEYRFGVRHKTSYLNFQELNGKFTPLTETGITFGLGIPLVNKWYGSKETTKNLIDIGMEYYQRGKNSDGLVKEDYFVITLGVTFNDFWFRRRKIY